jgi:hypothetical protein
MSIKHLFTNPHPDPLDTTLVKPSNWNAEHVIDGDVVFDSFCVGDGADQTREIYPGQNQMFHTFTTPFPGNGAYYDELLTMYGIINFSVSQPDVVVSSLDSYISTDPSYAGDLYQLMGVLNTSEHRGSGNIIESLVGGHYTVHNKGTGGIVANMFGGRFVYANMAAGLTTNAYGIQIESPSVEGGSSNNNITNAYGIYIQDQNRGTNKWNIYSAGATSRNYFEGKIGIGIDNPYERLDIDAGAIRMAAMSAPTTPVANSIKTYVTAAGITPTREIAWKVKLEDATEVILASILV